MSLDARDLSFGYRRQPVLDRVTATARRGRITALVGPNAAGKSTLLRCAAGALRPDAGEVTIDGIAPHRTRGVALARLIAYVPQRSTVAAAFTVREVVELGRYALPADPRRITQALEQLELATIAHRPYPALSVGQQQRVTLARALAQLEPEGCLILDEPTSAMDLRHARSSFRLLRRLAEEGAIVLIAMHDLVSATEIADDVWLLAPLSATERRGIRTGQAAAGNGARDGTGIGEPIGGGGGGGGGRGGRGGGQLVGGPVAEVMEAGRLASVFGVPFEWLEGPGGRRVLMPASTAGGRRE